MLLEIVKRILVALIATVLFSMTFAFFSYEPYRETNSYYISLLGLFVLISIYSGPVFIIAGVIWSIIIDTVCSQYLHAFIWYVIAGIVSAIAFTFIVLGGPPLELNKETFSILGLGIVGSLLYYHILIIWKTRFFKRSLYMN